MPEILLAGINAKWIHPSLALRLLKANLGDYEGRSAILEFALRQPLSEKVEPILAAAPRILGLSVSIWNHRATEELLDALEKQRGAGTRPLVVLGGPEVSSLPEEAGIFRRADWVVRGEGELVFRELCAALLAGAGGPPEGVHLPSARAVWTGASGTSFIEARPVETAAIDSGCRLYTDEDLRRKLVYVEASRGCPFRCEFCQGPNWLPGRGPDRTFQAQPVREFPLGRLLADLDTLINRGARTFKFLDRTFNLDIGRARRIMEFFLEKLDGAGDGTAAPPLRVHFEMVPARFPPELRETLRRFPPGTLRLELGIQTFNPGVSRLINRPGDPEKELETIAFLRRETAAIVHADLIAGLPGEDMASFGAGFDRLWRALSTGRPAAGTEAPFEIQPGILKLLPGAPLSRHGEPFGMRYAPEPPYEVVETAALGPADVDRLKNFARFWEILVNRRPFPDLEAGFCPPGEPVFHRFMALADSLLARFGRNWGIDRGDLRAALMVTGFTFLPLTEAQGHGV